jgi:hypothetical protein
MQEATLGEARDELHPLATSLTPTDGQREGQVDCPGYLMAGDAGEGVAHHRISAVRPRISLQK